MRRENLVALIVAVMLASIVVSCAQAQTWTNAQLLNDAVSAEVKSCQLWPASGGGFHAAFWVKAGASHICYRKYQNGYLSPQVTVFTSTFAANPSVCESYDGRIFMSWEDWTYDPLVSVGTGVSTDGQNWQRQVITPLHYTKHPVVLPYGGGSKVMMTYAAPVSNQVRYALFDGGSWNPEQTMSVYLYSEYQSGWACTSPKDGSIWRLWGNQQGAIYWYICRWNGTAWETPIRVNDPLPDGFPARPGIAANSAGHVAVTWDENNAFWLRVYDTNTGTWRQQIKITDKGSLYGGPNITDIPGTTDFYVAYDGYGRRYYGATNSFGPQENMIVGMSHGFTPDTAVCAGADGTIYAAFENWNTGTAQWYYAVRPASTSGPVGTIAGKVVDQYGVAVPGVTVGTGIYSALTNASGDYVLSNVPVGTHTVAANKQFYNGHTITGVSVYQNQTTPLNFTIQAIPPDNVSGLNAAASDGVVRLYWTNPTSGNYAATVVVFKTNGVPTSPTDGTVIFNATAAAGSPGSLVHSNLPNDVRHYYTVFTRDSENHYSSGVTISAVPHSMTCMEAKLLGDMIDIDLKGKVITGVFPGEGCIYVEEPDRSSGIRVATNTAGLAVGDVVNIVGKTGTRSLSGYRSERQISNATVTDTEMDNPLQPVAMTCLAVGGAPIGSLVPGVKDGVGLNNIGLLVKIFGKVTYKAGAYIYIDDGSNVENLYGLTTKVTGIMVKCPSTPNVAVGNVVSATGIVQGSVPNNPDWNTNRRYIVLRTPDDLH